MPTTTVDQHEAPAGMIAVRDALATGHQFSDCADAFMRAKQKCEKEREEWKYKAGTAEQALREACCLLRECLPFITGGPPGYLNNRISVWLETAYPPNAGDHRAGPGGER